MLIIIDIAFEIIKTVVMVALFLSPIWVFVAMAIATVN